MDKVKLYRNIARVRKQMFAIISLVGFLAVSVATLLGHGMNFMVLFRNSIIAILLFGILSYVLGMIYEKIIEEPLVDSYRKEAKERIEELKKSGNQRMAMKMNVSDAEPGYRVVEPIYSKEGALLVRGGATLNERLIKVLKENDVQQVKVEAQRTVQSEGDE